MPGERARDRAETAIAESAKRPVGDCSVRRWRAREARCGTQRHDRYFSGLEGVIDAAGESLAASVKRRPRLISTPRP